MTLAAIVLSAVWFLTAFALRIGIQLRRTGDSGVRVDAGGRLSPAWWASVGITSAIGVVAAVPVLAALDVVAPLDVDRAIGVAGALLATLGIVATFGAQLAMGASWRIGVDPAERTALVTTGVFAVVRNPIFSTMGLTAVGLTLMVSTVAGIAALGLLALALEAQVRVVEEPYLLDTHGAAYRAYVERVGRFVPGLGRS
jgi:protein-S-isoprenylcysteine O-methyltransferase Ste14